MECHSPTTKKDPLTGDREPKSRDKCPKCSYPVILMPFIHKVLHQKQSSSRSLASITRTPCPPRQGTRSLSNICTRFWRNCFLTGTMPNFTARVQTPRYSCRHSTTCITHRVAEGYCRPWRSAIASRIYRRCSSSRANTRNHTLTPASSCVAQNYRTRCVNWFRNNIVSLSRLLPNSTSHGFTIPVRLMSVSTRWCSRTPHPSTTSERCSLSSMVSCSTMRL